MIKTAFPDRIPVLLIYIDIMACILCPLCVLCLLICLSHCVHFVFPTYVNDCLVCFVALIVFLCEAGSLLPCYLRFDC